MQNSGTQSERFEKFTSLILSINRSIQRIKSEAMSMFGLNGVHVNCLHYLLTQGDLSQGELTKLCREDKAYMSRAIAKLIKVGMIAQNTDQKRRYHTALSLTESGRAVALEVAKMVESAVFAGSLGLTDGNRTELYGCLEKVNTNLENYIIKEA